jgi:hypothetical protein
MSRLVQLVADYGPGDLAYAELVQRLALTVPAAVVTLTPVASGDTVAAGFCVAQLALCEGPSGRVVAHDVRGAQPADDRLCVGRTHDGVWIVGPNSGWSWSFAVDELPSLCHSDVTAGCLASAITHVANRHPHAIWDAAPREAVPPVPERVVAYVDAAGNVKTTIATPPAPAGAAVQVRIGSVAARAVVSDGRTVPDGELALATGWPGWPTRDGGRRCFVELVVGGGSAAARFERPAPGTAVGLRPARSRSRRVHG